MAEIKWFGHACVRIRTRDFTILIDPVSPVTGYHMSRQRADVVAVTHEHPGHHALDLVREPYHLIHGPGEYEIRGVFITGIRTFHDDEGGKRHGKNTTYVFEVDDLILCHLGDIGHVLTDAQAEQLSAVDVLFVPVGGSPTITPQQAVEIIGQVEPSIVVPLQYRTEHGDRDRAPLEVFLREVGAAEVVPRETLTIRKSDLGETMQVVVLTPGG